MTKVRRNRAGLAAIAAVVILAFILASWYLFRWKHLTPNGYDATLQYRWGEPYRLEVDRNHDGSIDMLIELHTGKSGLVVDEMWVDTDHDGRFDQDFILRDSKFIAELDTDGDGSYDKTLTGDDARKIYPGVLGPVAH